MASGSNVKMETEFKSIKFKEDEIYGNGDYKQLQRI